MCHLLIRGAGVYLVPLLRGEGGGVLGRLFPRVGKFFNNDFLLYTIACSLVIIFPRPAKIKDFSLLINMCPEVRTPVPGGSFPPPLVASLKRIIAGCHFKIIFVVSLILPC